MPCATKAAINSMAGPHGFPDSMLRNRELYDRDRLDNDLHDPSFFEQGSSLATSLNSQRVILSLANPYFQPAISCGITAYLKSGKMLVKGKKDHEGFSHVLCHGEISYKGVGLFALT